LAQARPARRVGFSLMPLSGYPNAAVGSFNITAAATASSPAVHGNGTVGQISKWIGTAPSGDSILGDSIITESNGNIGIGLTAPMSKLTVQGMIESTLGGYKFPDGTIQTTAAITSIFHDGTLTGNGTLGSPLGIAPGGVGPVQIANGAVVRSLNGLFDNVS